MNNYMILFVLLTMSGSLMAQLSTDLNNKSSQNEPKSSYNQIDNTNATFVWNATATTGDQYWQYDPRFGGSSDLHWKVVMNATLNYPYITIETGSKTLMLKSSVILGKEIHVPPFARPQPIPYPVVILGNQGKYTTLYTTDFPYRSNFSLSNSSDYFSGNGKSVLLDRNQNNPWGEWGRLITNLFWNIVEKKLFIPPPPHGEPLWLAKGSHNGEFKLESYIWVNLLTGPEGAFWNEGNISLEDIQISTGNLPGELGSCNINIPLEGAYVYVNAAGLAGMEFVKTLPPLNFTLQYVRGDHILEPTFQMSSRAYQLNTGDTTTITLTVNNNSQVVSLEGGNVTLSVGSLKEKFNVLSPATIDINTIDIGSSKEFNFLVEAAGNGIVTPQTIVSGMRYGWPAGSKVINNPIWSIDKNIIVGNPNSIENDDNEVLPREFTLNQNYPNPFNPKTTISFTLSKADFIILSVYDMVGREVMTLVNEFKQAGVYSVIFEADDLASGIYYYRLRAGNLSQTKKMLVTK